MSLYHFLEFSLSVFNFHLCDCNTDGPSVAFRFITEIQSMYLFIFILNFKRKRPYYTAYVLLCLCLTGL